MTILYIKIRGNINNLYSNFMTKKQYTRITIPPGILESKVPVYNKMNDMYLKDFLDKDKNTLCSLPPSVLFLLLIKIDPKINEMSNPWNIKLKNLLASQSLTCEINKSSVEEMNKKIMEMNTVTEKLLTDKLETFIKRADDLKCSRDITKKSINQNLDECNELKNSIEIFKKNITDLKKNKQPGIIYEKTLKTALKFTGADSLVNGICDNKIKMDIFDGLLDTLRVMNSSSVLKLFNFTDNKKITHSIIRSVAGIITYLPVDMKQIFHVLLQYTKGSPDEIYFDKIYDEYKKRIFEDFTSPSKQLYY